ncbi:hypothetical protein NUW58_g5061 [Xylaria curta]|uniref:Uncharacterized protein n=1 Tax=Xylaria curta TaxID=42375 RepID=A0ACC1P4R6_9PEZI|nr:hypothetical protein NUW58_g5061 [Xylaria curta]
MLQNPDDDEKVSQEMHLISRRDALVVGLHTASAVIWTSGKELGLANAGVAWGAAFLLTKIAAQLLNSLQPQPARQKRDTVQAREPLRDPQITGVLHALLPTLTPLFASFLPFPFEMPKIKSYTPAWLSSPSPGHQLFAPNPDDTQNTPYAPRAGLAAGPRRTIAIRGTQVFIAVGKEIRWADLVYLKEKWQEKAAQGRGGVRIKRESSDEVDDDDIIKASVENGCAEGFRTIKPPAIASEIQQLIISPYANYIAVLTANTVRIILIPDPTHLTVTSSDAIKPKSWSLGPIIHANDRSPIASALWHPLGVNGSTLVTVTADAVVRVWELVQKDRWSFDSPALTIDLRKLADGISLDQNFSADEAEKKAFSPDSFEMEVAAASLAARGSGGWSSMTLWVAMKGGDVYALCPLLPSQWAPPPTLIPSLSISIVGNLAAIEDDPNVSEQAKLLAQQQLDWMSDLDNQEPRVIDGPAGEPPTEIYTRPSRPGVVPRLQGPFILDLGPESEDERDLSLTDIYVIGEKLDTDELMFGEDEELEMEDAEGEGLSLSVICLLSPSGRAQICLDINGTQAQWLPPRNKSKTMGPMVGSPTLLTFSTLDTLDALEVTETAWPVFSPDVTSRYSFYTTHSSSITYISLAPWVFRLESELQGDSEAGSEFRINVLVNGQVSTRERLYNSLTQGDAQLPLSAAVLTRDPDLGYFLLSATPFEPIVLTFESPEDDFVPFPSTPPSFSQDAEVRPLEFFEPRPVYQPSHVFDESSALPGFIERLRTSRFKTIMNQEIRLSPLTLQLFTEAHQVLSDETHKLGVAASEVFLRCVKLQDELRQQITKANEVKARVEAITNEDQVEDGEEPESSNAAVERRLRNAKEKGEALGRRLEKMRKTINKATNRELSKKEEDWVKEVKALDAGIYGSAHTTDGANRAKQWMDRYQRVTELKDELEEQAQALEAPANEEDHASSPRNDLRIPSELRRAKISQVRSLLERETALVEAVKSRLERLSVAV